MYVTFYLKRKKMFLIGIFKVGTGTKINKTALRFLAYSCIYEK